MLLVGCSGSQEEKSSVTVSQMPEEVTSPTLAPITEKPNSYYSNYTITMDLEPAEGKIKAIQKVTYKNESTEELNQLCMNVYLNSLSEEMKILPYPEQYSNEVYSNGIDHSWIKIQSLSANSMPTEYNLDGTLLKIRLKEPLEPQEETELTLEFDAYIPKISHKMGRNNEAVWLGNALPSMAVYQNGIWNTSPYYGFGEPFYSNVGNYDVTITTPDSYTIIAPGSLTSSSENGKKTTRIIAKMVRDFSFAAEQGYEVISVETGDGIDINLYCRPENASKAGSFLLSAKKELEFYVKIVGSYPYQKLDLIECNLFFPEDAQYSQFVLLDEDILKENPTDFSFQFGYQWFNCVIGTNQRGNGWLNIGITEFLQAYSKYSTKELSEFFDTEAEELKQLSLLAMNTPLSKITSYEQYQNSVRRRSTLMIYSLYRTIGQEKFFQLIQNYYSAYSFQTVDPNEFVAMSQNISGQNLTEFFNQWVQETEIP